MRNYIIKVIHFCQQKLVRKNKRDRSENVLKDFQEEASDDLRLHSVLKSIVHRKVVTCSPVYASTPGEK